MGASFSNRLDGSGNCAASRSRFARPSRGDVAKETKHLSGIRHLVFVAECQGAGYVAFSLPENILSTGRHAPLDLLGPM